MKISDYKKLIGKSKYNAKKCSIDGISFDSLAEGDFYRLLIADELTSHVDCHVALTLPGGVRYKIDFLLWKKSYCNIHDKNDSCVTVPEAIEIKGMSTESFKIKRKLFDAFHPLKPLNVYKRVGKRWESI